MNWGIKVLQTSALPLGYVAMLVNFLKYCLIKLARVGGFEPPHDGIRIRCLTAWRYPIIRIRYLLSVVIFNWGG